MTPNVPKPTLTKTLLLTVALPDFYAEDLTRETADEFYGGDMLDMGHEEMGLLSGTLRVFLMTGDKGGNDLHDARGVLVGLDVVDRVEAHDEPEDERLTDALAEWRERER